MSSHDGPSEAEFQESIRDWGLTKWYAWSTIVSGVVLAAASVVLLATGTRPGVAAVLLVVSVLVILLAVLGLRRVQRLERDPTAPNPRDNAVARGLFRFEKKHPVLNVVLAVALVAAAIWLKLR